MAPCLLFALWIRLWSVCSLQQNIKDKRYNKNIPCFSPLIIDCTIVCSTGTNTSRKAGMLWLHCMLNSLFFDTSIAKFTLFRYINRYFVKKLSQYFLPFPWTDWVGGSRGAAPAAHAQGLPLRPRHRVAGRGLPPVPPGGQGGGQAGRLHSGPPGGQVGQPLCLPGK